MEILTNHTGHAAASLAVRGPRERESSLRDAERARVPRWRRPC